MVVTMSTDQVKVFLVSLYIHKMGRTSTQYLPTTTHVIKTWLSNTSTFLPLPRVVVRGNLTQKYRHLTQKIPCK